MKRAQNGKKRQNIILYVKHNRLVSADYEDYSDFSISLRNMTMDDRVKKTFVRRICADYADDEATDIEMMEVALGIHRIRGKTDRDAALINVAFLALKRATSEYRTKTGKRYPSVDELVQWMARPESNATTTYRELRPE